MTSDDRRREALALAERLHAMMEKVNPKPVLSDLVLMVRWLDQVRGRSGGSKARLKFGSLSRF